MEIERRLRPDLWKAIRAHYERCDFTESVRDAVFHVCELLREKSGIEDKDGTKLVEAALMGSNPAIVVTKNETTTEKDFQQGIGFSFKGIMQAVRNPLSHEKTVYIQEDAEAIILYVNFLLNQVDRPGGLTKVENITKLLYDEDFTSTEEYAELLLTEVPAKKRYDLLVDLYSDRANLNQHILKRFIKKLFESLSKASKVDFIRMVNGSLMTCKNDTDLRMYLHYFMEFTYSELDKLVRLRIEDLIIKAVRVGKLVSRHNKNTGKQEDVCVSEATLVTWIVDTSKICLLGNPKDILSALIYKIAYGNVEEKEFVFKYFSNFILINIDSLSEYQIRQVIQQLTRGDQQVYDFLYDSIEVFEDEKICALFGEAFRKCEEVIESEEKDDAQLPF